eukprot:403348882
MGCCSSKKQSKLDDKVKDMKLKDENQDGSEDLDLSNEQLNNDKQDKKRTQSERRRFQEVAGDTPNDQDHELQTRITKSRVTKGNISNNQQQNQALQKQKSTRLQAGADLIDELKKSIYSNDEELLLEVLEQDPKLASHSVFQDKKVSILHIACQQCDNENVVKLLIRKGADIDCVDVKGWTPLMIAAMNANVSVVKILVNQGCNLGMESFDGRTAREFAVESLQVEEEKKKQDLKIKKKISDLHKILQLLPEERKAGFEDVTPNRIDDQRQNPYSVKNKI